MPLPADILCCCLSSSSSSSSSSAKSSSSSASRASSSSSSGSSSESSSSSSSGSSGSSFSGASDSSSSSSSSSSSTPYVPPFEDCACGSAPGTPGDFNGQTFFNECRRGSDFSTCTGGFCMSTWIEPDPIGNPGIGSWILTIDRCSRA